MRITPEAALKLGSLAPNRLQSCTRSCVSISNKAHENIILQQANSIKIEEQMHTIPESALEL